MYDPDRKVLIDGALELLDLIKAKNIPMVLIGKGAEDMQREVKRLGVDKYFRQIVFAEGDKDPQVFMPFVLKADPERTLFIGDRVRSELEIGKKLGAVTVWVRQGKFASETPQNHDQKPDYAVSSLRDCLSVISGLN